MKRQTNKPKGDLLLRTVGMPADTNPNGDIFGGWIMSQMDIAGGMLAIDLSGGRVATIAVESMKFIHPVRVGDTVCCYGFLKQAGRTSLTLQLEIWVSSLLRTPQSQPFKVTEAAFVYVAIDENGKKRELPRYPLSEIEVLEIA